MKTDSQTIKVHDEIFRLMQLIDCKWDKIISRKDACIDCGMYYIRSNNRNTVTINNTNVSNSEIISFRKMDEVITSSLRYNKIELSSMSDEILIFDFKTWSSYKIPYDSTASIEERKFSIDLEISSNAVGNLLYRIVDFQALKLKNINLFVYESDNDKEVLSGEIYDTISSRPFFRTK